MNQMVSRAVACSTAVVATLAAVGVTVAPSQAEDQKPSRLAQIVRDDPTAALDSDGRLFYTEPLPAGAHAVARAGTIAPGRDPQFPLEETFLLHSNPGSQRTIYLDFDGGTVSGTAWNQEGLPAGNHPAWDPDGNAVRPSTPPNGPSSRRSGSGSPRTTRRSTST